MSRSGVYKLAHTLATLLGLTIMTEREIKIAHEQILTALMTNTDELSSRAWAVFFKDTDTNNYLCYDSKDPVNTLKAILKAHPNYRYVGMRGCDSQGTAIEYAKALRLVSKLIPIIKKQEEAFNEATKLNN